MPAQKGLLILFKAFKRPFIKFLGQEALPRHDAKAHGKCQRKKAFERPSIKAFKRPFIKFLGQEALRRHDAKALGKPSESLETQNLPL